MTLRLVIALLLLIGGAPGAHTQELANPMCPVMTWEPASAEIQVTFGEKPVYFCCDDCKEDFRAEPGKYLAALPQFEGVDHQRLLAAHRGRDLLGGMRPLLWGLAALMAVVLVVRLRRLRSAGGAKGAEGSGAAGGASPLWKLVVAALLGLLLPLGILYYRAREELKRRDRIELIHWSTVHDFGMPPRPRHPPFAARVDGTYWRGNDERNPKLFNGGLYRTSVFHVKLRLPGGETLGHGGAAGGVAPELVYEIERAPHTPDFFWSDEIMGSIFVSRRSGYFVGSPEEPATDAVRLEALEPMQRWEAAYRLEKVPATGAFRDRGVLYVFEEVYEKDAASGAETMIGGRYHYGIEYDLRYQDGVLQPESDLWMGFLYRTRKAGLNKIWPDEWFSHEPLPVIPAPQGLDDAALGIDDRKPGGAAGNQG